MGKLEYQLVLEFNDGEKKATQTFSGHAAGRMSDHLREVKKMGVSRGYDVKSGIYALEQENTNAWLREPSAERQDPYKAESKISTPVFQETLTLKRVEQ